MLSGLAAEVPEITGARPVLLVREGEPREELPAQIDQDPRISVLVLATAAAATGPGPLVTALSGHHSQRLRVPMVVVPGGLDDAAPDRLT